MGKKKRILAVLILFFFFTPGFVQPSPEDSKGQERAVEATRNWLALVDQGNYGKSWETAAGYFKGAVTEKQWEQAMNAVRSPLGKVISRRLKSKHYVTSLPGAPDGEYVVIQFETSFEKKKSSVETITPMKEKDGTWRISGYFIK
jgi:hypothetical protein